MMSLLEQARLKKLEERIESLESRLEIVERAEAFEQAEPMKRKPGRPRKIEENIVA